MEIRRLLALVSDSCPWIPRSSVLPVNVTGTPPQNCPCEIYVFPVDPQTFMTFQVWATHTIASIAYEETGSSKSLLDPVALDNLQWSDFVGWVANAVGAYKEMRTQDPLRCAVVDNYTYDSDGIELVLTNQAPLLVHPVTRMISTDGGTWHREPCLHAYMRNWHIVPTDTRNPVLNNLINSGMVPEIDDDDIPF